MRILLWHVDYLKVKPTEKALKNPPEQPWLLDESNCLLVFVAGEQGDTAETITKAKEEIMAVAKNLGVNKIILYPYVHLTNKPNRPKEAYMHLLQLEEALKPNIDVKRAPFGWYKSFEVKVKGHPMSELSRKV